MKKRFKKLILFGSGLFAISLIPLASFTMIKSISSNGENINKVNSQTNAITSDSTSSDFTIELYKDYQSLSWYDTEFADSVTETQLKELLIPSLEFDVNYGINILTPTDTAKSEGYVEFAVYKVVTNFENGVASAPSSSSDSQSDSRTWIEPTSDIDYTDGSNSGIDMRAYTDTSTSTNTVTINGSSIEQKYVWTTKNISGLFLPYKYSFSWNTNEQIGSFLEETLLTPETLTAEDVYANMISRANTTDILPDDTETNLDSIITVSTSNLSSYGISQEDAKTYGIALVTVDFSKSTDGNEADKWVDDAVPNETYLVRGLYGTNGKETMHLSTSDANGDSNFLNTTFSVAQIEKDNTNFTLPASVSSSATTVKVSDFTPTELINVLLADQSGNGILRLLTTQDYLSDTSQTPALYLSYMGSNAFTKDTTASSSTFTASDSWGGTGLKQGGNVARIDDGVVNSTDTVDPADTSTISSISATADDATGTLDLKITYNYFDVYQNAEVMDYTTSVTITGLQTSDTDSTSSNQGYYLQWKSVDDLLYDNANDVMTLYNNNSNNSQFLQSLSNSFFTGSAATYNLVRTVNMSVNGNDLTITLTFSDFGNNTYQDGNTTLNGLKTSMTYTLNGTSASDLGVSFKTLDDSYYSTYTPNEFIDAIALGEISLSNLVSTSGNYTYTTSISQAPTNNGVLVTVNATNGANTYKTSQIYSGFLTGTSDSYIYNFAFGSANDDALTTGIATLRAKAFEDITLDDVYNDYVLNLPIASVLDISESDVSIQKNTDSQTITVTISINSYNGSTTLDNTSDSDQTDNKTFTNTLNGFISEVKTNNDSNKSIADLTIPLSVGLGVVVIVIMIAVLVYLIIKRKRLNKSKINLKELRKSNK